MILIFISILSILFTSTLSAKDLGEFGITYPIAERDALEEIQEKVKKVDWSRFFNKEKISNLVRRYKPRSLPQLPVAREDKVFTVDLTFRLEFDIPDGKGGILYPEGYTFNPLDYVVLPNTLVFINGADEEQLKWFRDSEYYKDPKVMLLITDGSYYKVSQKLHRAVFYADRTIIERLKINAQPSVLRQKGRVMEVREYAIPIKKPY